jgi:hypothetical protein
MRLPSAAIQSGSVGIRLVNTYIAEKDDNAICQSYEEFMGISIK